MVQYIVSLTVIFGGKRLNSSGHNRGLPKQETVMSQQWFPDDAGASLSPAAQPCGAVEPAPVAAVPPAHPPAEQPAPPSDKPVQPAH